MRRGIWAGFGAFVLATIAIIGVAVDADWFSSLNTTHDGLPEASVLGASVLGASVLLASGVIGGFVLMVARVNAATAMMNEVTDVRSRLGTTEAHLAAIRRFRESREAAV